MRTLPRAAAAAVLAAAGLLHVHPSAEARLVRADQPGGSAERGGQDVPPGNRTPPVCLGALAPGLDYAFMVPFTLGAACLGLQQTEALARFAAAARLSIPDRSAAWRAPRLAGRFAVLRRFDVARHHRGFLHLP